jgi:hypothetical protein
MLTQEKRTASGQELAGKCFRTLNVKCWWDKNVSIYAARLNIIRPLYREANLIAEAASANPELDSSFNDDTDLAGCSWLCQSGRRTRCGFLVGMTAGTQLLQPFLSIWKGIKSTAELRCSWTCKLCSDGDVPHKRASANTPIARVRQQRLALRAKMYSLRFILYYSTYKVYLYYSAYKV